MVWTMEQVANYHGPGDNPELIAAINYYNSTRVQYCNGSTWYASNLINPVISPDRMAHVDPTTPAPVIGAGFFQSPSTATLMADAIKSDAARAISQSTTTPGAQNAESTTTLTGNDVSTHTVMPPSAALAGQTPALTSGTHTVMPPGAGLTEDALVSAQTTTNPTPESTGVGGGGGGSPLDAVSARAAAASDAIPWWAVAAGLVIAALLLIGASHGGNAHGI